MTIFLCKGTELKKYKGFPSKVPGTNFQLIIRRENLKGASKLIERKRFKDRRSEDKKADKYFLNSLIKYFGESNFERGCLDAGRLSWLLNREIIRATEDFNPCDYKTLLKLDYDCIKKNYPDIELE